MFETIFWALVLITIYGLINGIISLHRLIKRQNQPEQLPTADANSNNKTKSKLYHEFISAINSALENPETTYQRLQTIRDEYEYQLSHPVTAKQEQHEAKEKITPIEKAAMYTPLKPQEYQVTEQPDKEEKAKHQPEPAIQKQEYHQEKTNTPFTTVVSNWYQQNSITFLLYVGAFLTVVSAITFLTFTWDSLHPIIRFTTFTLVTLGFLIAGLNFYKKPHVSQAGVTFLGISALLFPLNGVAFQTFLLPPDAPTTAVWIITSMLCVGYYIFLFREIPSRFYAVILNLSSLSLVSAYISMFSFPDETYILGAILVSFGIYLANYSILKTYRKDIKELNDGSSHVLIILSLAYGLLTLLFQGNLFTWTATLTLALTSLYYGLRYKLSDKRNFIPMHIFMFLAVFFAFKTGEASSLITTYILSTYSIVTLGSIAFFQQQKESEEEIEYTEKLSHGFMLFSLFHVLFTIPRMTNDWEFTITVLLAAIYYITRYFLGYRKSFTPAAIFSFLSIFTTCTTLGLTRLNTILNMFTVIYAFFGGVKLLHKRKKLPKEEVSWMAYINVLFCTFLCVYVFIWESTTTIYTWATTITLTLTFFYSFLFYFFFSRKAFGVGYALAYITLFFLLKMVEADTIWSIITFFAIIYATLGKGIWLHAKNHWKEEYKQLPFLTIGATILTLLFSISAASGVLHSWEVVTATFLSSGIFFLMWRYVGKKAFIPGNILLILGFIFLFRLIELPDVVVSLMILIYAYANIAARVVFESLRSQFKQEKRWTLDFSLIYGSFAVLHGLIFELPANELVWLFVGFEWLMVVSFLVSRHNYYLYILFTAAPVTLHLLNSQYFVPPGQDHRPMLGYLLSAGAVFPLMFYEKKKPYDPALLYGSILHLFLSSLAFFTDISAIHKLSIYTINTLISLILVKKWENPRVGYASALLFYTAIYSLIQWLDAPEYMLFGMYVGSTVIFFSSRLLGQHIFMAKHIHSIRMFGILSAWLFTLFGYILHPREDLESFLNVIGFALSSLLVTEYWRIYRTKGLEYLVAFLWVVTLLRYFRHIGITNAQWYIQPIAYYIIGSGIYQWFRHDENARLLTNLGLVVSIFPLFMNSFGVNGTMHAVYLGLQGIVLMGYGISIQYKTLRNGGLIALALAIFARTGSYIFIIPKWLLIGILGIGTLIVATHLMERKKK